MLVPQDAVQERYLGDDDVYLGKKKGQTPSPSPTPGLTGQGLASGCHADFCIASTALLKGA